MTTQTAVTGQRLPDVEKTSRALTDAFKSLSGLKLPPAVMTEVQSEYLQQATELWNQSLAVLKTGGGEGKPGSAPAIKDRRFASPEWAGSPHTSFMAQLYLLNARTLLRMADSVQGDDKTRQRIRFAVQQWVDASAPSNFLALNPEAIQRAVQTKGESLGQGLRQLMQDLQQGHLSQTDEAQFEVGRNVATTPGSVVYENAFFQLLEYAPSTPQVHERPMLFVPPCINKYYILDLQPENSLIRHTVGQGHRLFVVSWRNADKDIANATWDQYIEDGACEAIRVTQRISGSDQINVLGFCVGGTILATALSVLAARGERPASSVTLLTTFLDFSSTGILDVFIDESMVQLREASIGQGSLSGPGLLKGKELATTFSFLRPNELVWNYVVGNYLKGESPPPFDLLYWNSDSTNLPGPMYCWYLRNTYLENKLAQPGAVTVCGQPVDLGSIQAPTYIYASREDHIVPWEGAYRSTQLLKGDLRFVMGASGHIAGVINPPAKKKRSHWIADAETMPANAAEWLEQATEHPGSWWPDWSEWLAGYGGKMIPAPKTPGNDQYPPIEPAPGRYVKQKA